MSQPEPVVDARLQHLLAVVERNRAQRCQAVIEAAEQQARQIVSQSYGTARTRTHADFGALREHIRQRLASAEAQQQTRLRQSRQQADRAFLLAAWQPLRQALQRHWQETGHREQWVRQLVHTAASMLTDAHWLIEHPGDWPEHERDALLVLLDRDVPLCPAPCSGSVDQRGLADLRRRRLRGRHDRRPAGTTRAHRGAAARRNQNTAGCPGTDAPTGHALTPGPASS